MRYWKRIEIFMDLILTNKLDDFCYDYFYLTSGKSNGINTLKNIFFDKKELKESER